jgi:hypothetical protein
VPYAIVPINKTVQTPVIMAPIGKMRMLRPGSTNGLEPVTTRVCIGGATTDLVMVVLEVAAKTPLTKVASSEERVVLTVVPEGVLPERVTMGTRICCNVVLLPLLI